MKILVVDDDPIILDLVPLALYQNGENEITVAPSGAAALDIIHLSEEPFEVMVLDIEMPEMDGVELCANIRNMEVYRRTPIIMLTTRSDPYSIESAFSAGANDYITKPFDIKAIGTRLRIAQRMMRDTCKVFTLSSLSGVLPEPFSTHDFDATDALVISGLDHHTDPFSLGNYLSQLEQKKAEESSIFAMKIDVFDSLHTELSGRELLLTIAEVSNSISSVTSDRQVLNAYFGSGMFMCIAPNDLLESWLEVEGRIDAILSHFDPIQRAGFSDSFAVTMGRPIRPNLSKTQRVRPTFDRAKLQLERRTRMNNIVS